MRTTSVTRLVIAMVVMFTVTKAFSATVECTKVDGERGVRPSNALAKEIALKLNVKTCNGKRFRDVVLKLGATHNIPATSASYATTDDVVKSIKTTK